MSEFSKGDRVRHPIWGSGVLLVRKALERALVEFDDSPGLSRSVRRTDLMLEGASDDDAPEPSQPAPVLTSASAASIPPLPRDAKLEGMESLPLDRADAWQTLEALRLGVVPAKGIQHYTVARERELGSMGELFERGHGCRILWGDYGTGKTHLLETAETLALEQGYAVSRITLDPRENALNHPLRLYRSITESIRTRDQVSQGFEGLFDRLVDSPEHYKHDGKSASRFFTPYLFALRHGDTEDIGWLQDYVRGDNVDAAAVNAVLRRIHWQGERVLRLSDFRTYGRMYAFMISTLACWCADAGARGLILLFDEVERVEALDKENQRLAAEVLKNFAALTIDPADLVFDPESLYKGGQAAHRALPLRFRADIPLGTVFALTPLEEIVERVSELTVSDAYSIHLGPLQPDLVTDLVARMARLYRHAFSEDSLPNECIRDVQEKVLQALDGGHDSFRDAVRTTVFLFDEHRLGRGA